MAGASIFACGSHLPQIRGKLQLASFFWAPWGSIVVA
jgi:hypothetical protein